MESAIRLCYRPLPLLHQSKGLIANTNSNSSRLLLFHHQQQQQHHTLFNHASLCASHFPTRSSSSSFPPPNCIPNRLSLPSNRSEESVAPTAAAANNNRVLRGLTGISIVLACVVGLINFNSKMNPMFKTAYAQIPGFPGPKTALNSLLEDFTTPKPSNRMPKEPNVKLEQKGIEELKSYAIGLSKSGKQREAENTLKNKLKPDLPPEELSNLKLALVELLIIQGNFKAAKEQLDSHIKEFFGTKFDTKKSISENLHSFYEKSNKIEEFKIAQMTLYKYIIETKLKNEEEANKLLELFIKMLQAELKNEDEI